MPSDLPRNRDLDEATLQRLMSEAEVVHLAPGDVVFAKGDAPEHLYLACSGRLVREGDHGTTGIHPGDLFGLVESLSGERRTGTVTASEPVELRRLPSARLDEILAEHPRDTERLVEVAERQLLRRDLARLLPDLFAALGAEALNELSEAFSWLRIDRGEALFVEGGPSEGLYVLASGRLEARVATEKGYRVVGEIVPRETVGEMAVLTGEPRSATVVALRTSVLLFCGVDDFERLVARYPLLLRHMAEIVIERLNRANRLEPLPELQMSVAVVPLHPTAKLDAFSADLLATMGSYGSALRLDRATAERAVRGAGSSFEDRLGDLRLLPWFEEQESNHDFVVYQADPEWTPWTHRCVSQADRIVLVADADSDPAPGDLEVYLEDAISGARPPMHLVLLHPSDRDRPRDTPRWLEPRELTLHHHVRHGQKRDAARVARLLTGRALGLVLSGGGARGFAHIGVFQALEELGVEVDAIAGTSAGAAMACQFAMGRRADEILHAMRHQFVRRKPFKKYTLPVYSLVSVGTFDAILKDIAGGRDITDLWIPFFCNSCDLQTGEKVLHHRGPLWKAARASMSLPGILPPVVDGSRLLVDGGVLDNIPEEEMLEFCGGRVIAVDVSGGAPIRLDYEYEDMPSVSRLVRDRLNPWAEATKVPTIVDVMVRTATVSNASQQAVEDTVELVLRPPIQRFGLLEFDAIDEIASVAAEHARELVPEWLGESG